ncbi:MAG: RIP metalloprotease RseP [Sphingomonadales bacterium]
MDIPTTSPSLLFTIGSFLVVITILVFVHEMGHFLVARFFKVKVDAFSIGFGRELIGFTDKLGTRWKIAPFPVGGYVKFAGDANAASTPSQLPNDLPPEEQAKLFQNKPLYQRALIVAAGPLVIFLFAILVIAGLFMTLGQPYSEPVITSLLDPSPGKEAGFEPGDRILAINGSTVKTFEEVRDFVVVRPNVQIEMTVQRGEGTKTLSVTPMLDRQVDRFGNEFERGLIGLYASRPAFIERGPIEALYYGTIATWQQLGNMMDGLWQIVSGRISVDQLSGPVRIAKLSGEVASVSAISLVQFMAFISISLGLVNLFPIPMLDGGHLLFYGYEAVRRRPPSLKSQEAAMYAGLATVLGFSLFVTWNDLKALIVWEGLSKLVS